jgi:hypothetical protein
MDKLEHETISFIKELVGYKSVGGNKWFDEIQKSFGSFYIFKTVCKSDSRLIHALSEMSGKSYSLPSKTDRSLISHFKVLRLPFLKLFTMSCLFFITSMNQW